MRTQSTNRGTKSVEAVTTPPRVAVGRVAGRIYASALVGPLRQPASRYVLIGGVLLFWITLGAVISFAAGSPDEVFGAAEAVLRSFSAVTILSAFLFAFPLVAWRIRNGATLLELLQPVDRATYYSALIAGRATIAAIYYYVSALGFYCILYLIAHWSFSERTLIQSPTFAWALALGGLTVVSVVVSVSAVSTIASGRVAHVVYWWLMFTAVVMARVGGELSSGPSVELIPRIIVDHVVAPVLIGGDPTSLGDAALSWWHFGQIVARWGFGSALAWILGMMGFSRMEVALYR